MGLVGLVPAWSVLEVSGPVMAAKADMAAKTAEATKTAKAVEAVKAANSGALVEVKKLWGG